MTAGDDALLAYALVFRDVDAYDGEEFLVLRSLVERPFLYIRVALLARDLA